MDHAKVPWHSHLIPSYMLNNNKPVVILLSILHAKLHKQCTTLSFHCICIVIASKYVKFYFYTRWRQPSQHSEQALVIFVLLEKLIIFIVLEERYIWD